MELEGAGSESCILSLSDMRQKAIMWWHQFQYHAENTVSSTIGHLPISSRFMQNQTSVPGVDNSQCLTMIHKHSSQSTCVRIPIY